jgi:predicted AAA+ superfamily ATPase
LVAIELRRRGREFFYFRQRGECDFVVVDGGRPVSAIQVCWEINEKNRKREVGGILDARRELGELEALILSYDGGEAVDEIPQMPVWRWLLEGGR